MIQFFLKFGYPQDLLHQALSKVMVTTKTQIRYKRRYSATQNHSTRKRIPFVMTYGPLTTKIRKIIITNFKQILQQEENNSTFQTIPITAYRREKNLNDILVTSDLKTNDREIGTIPCKNSRCRTCHYVISENKIKSSTHQSAFYIKNSFNCTSAYIIYGISCSICKSIYIGETGRSLRNRTGEHLRNIEHKVYLQIKFMDKEDYGISSHFNSLGHNISNFQIQALTYAPRDTESRKLLEKRIMTKLNSFVPNGMNKR